MSSQRPFAHVIDLLKHSGLRPTRQRLALAKLLFEQGNRHVTAEQLHAEVQAQNISVSLATVYNTLHQFTDVGLLREVVVDPGRSYFDTNIDDHHHFFFEESSELRDIPVDAVNISSLPTPPDGMQIDRVDIVVRLSSRGPKG